MKHFETKFASTDFKVNLSNLKKIKKFFLEKNRFFKKLIRNFNLPDISIGNVFQFMQKHVSFIVKSTSIYDESFLR